MNNLTISLITVCFNSEKTIRNTIESVLSQTYAHIEYIIVDGKSTDNTLLIINEYKRHIAKIISEPDKGIYDAMNKGIAAATGDVVGILNSDDIFYDMMSIELIATSFSKHNTDAVFANLIFVNNKNHIVRVWKSSKAQSFKSGWMPAHPTLYCRKSIYEQYDPFRLDMGTAADYEFMLRIFEKEHISSFFLDHFIVKMLTGGASTKNFSAMKKTFLMELKAWKINHLKGALCAAILIKIRRIPQILLFKTKFLRT